MVKARPETGIGTINLEKEVARFKGAFPDSDPMKNGSSLNYPRYDSKQRFCSYWHQINEVMKIMPEMMIEIGIGNSFVSDYLKEGCVYLRLGHQEEVWRRYYLAEATNLPFRNDSFDIIACYQVLEHLPYESFVRSLKEMRRVVKTKILISIPDATPVMPVSFILPRLGGVQLLIPVPKLWMRPIPKNHMWELGRPPHNLKSVLNDIHDSGLRVIDTYRVFENPYHRFFVLSKICE